VVVVRVVVLVVVVDVVVANTVDHQLSSWSSRKLTRAAFDVVADSTMVAVPSSRPFSSTVFVVVVAAAAQAVIVSHTEVTVVVE
jgi:hypothetical protein